jgi:hypothetical protein
MLHLDEKITHKSKFEISSMVIIACLIVVLFLGFIIK